MASYYEITPGHTIHVMEGGGVFVFGERRRFFTESPVIMKLLPLLDGRRDLDGLIAAVASVLTPAEVHFALGRLERGGMVRATAEPSANPAATPARACEVTLTGHGLRVQGPDAKSARILAAALARVGLPLTESAAAQPTENRLVLVMLADLLGADAESAMTIARSQDAPWLPIKLAGERALVGPVFDGNMPPCVDCLRARLAANRPLEAWLERAAGRPIGLAAHPPAPVAVWGELAAEAVAARIARLLAGEHLLSALPRAEVLEWNGDGRAGHSHTVFPRAGCGNCVPALAAPPLIEEPPRINPATLATRQDGGFRTRPALETVAALRPLVGDLTGRISAIGPLELPDANRHVWAAVYPIAPRTVSPGPDDFHGVALGKGRSAAQAEASALCEAIERLSAQYRGDAPECVASLIELGDDAVSPAAIANFSTSQYRDRERWNAATTDVRRHVPPPLPPDQPIAWIRAWSLSTERWRWLPREHCFANTPPPTYGRFDPNGCAAGSCLEEAVAQGFLELVERDCVAIWWANRLHRPGLDPSNSADSVTRNLAAGLAAQGWQTWLLDLTHDLEVPCLAALARAKSDGRWCIGFGCHFNADIAVERAMTELVQLFRANGRDGPPPWQIFADGNDSFLYPNGEAIPRDAPVAGTATFAGLIEWSRDKLSRHGIEMIVLNQTDPDIGFSAVKVTAPGLRHFWPRFGPGRLYNVPVTMGWRAVPLAETALNSTHLFL